MYKNYKIGPDGAPKYDRDSYRVAPERRFTKHTEEWEKRLNSDPRKFRRRKRKQQEAKFTLKVKHVVYLVALLVIVGVVGNSNTGTMPISKSKRINITLNNAVRDFGNEFIKPSNGKLFLHVKLNLENKLNNNNNINISEFILEDENKKVYNVSYLNNKTEIMNLDLGPSINITPNITFEIPIDYKGELDLVFENDNFYNKNIAKFNLE
ncbi:DUF4352 domain-containing protein [Clostridium sp. CCUG 7971]|uniref:DUF4352 domain-containing protein n=1 Tax=Clostridium sp. CCUG 7971 TaxID=2811414 RepID=UPI001ABA8FF0|nr:DUF4352 domain-containing protein [Clostridium sp. CCUG 7971]MBO3445270.1 DUF4352 domain-containing protein [Clostridium sp. CCUG 7971]